MNKKERSIHREFIDILNKLIGDVGEELARQMRDNLECFLHPELSLFIPSRGHCGYAVMPSHTHPAYTFIYYFQPVSDFVVEGRHVAYDLAGGKCFAAMSPGVPHQEIEEEYFQSYIAIAVAKDLFEDTLRQYQKPVPVFKGEIFVPHPELLNLLRCFMLESGKEGNASLLDNLVGVIAHLIVKSMMTDTRQTVPLYDRFEVDRAIVYMNSHIAEKITVGDLAGRVNLSAGHFSKVFKVVTGETPIDFLGKLRLQKARSLLINGEKTITEIALCCGFHSSSYFSSCFLEKYSMTPSLYRQQVSKLERREY